MVVEIAALRDDDGGHFHRRGPEISPSRVTEHCSLQTNVGHSESERPLVEVADREQRHIAVGVVVHHLYWQRPPLSIDDHDLGRACNHVGRSHDDACVDDRPRTLL